MRIALNTLFMVPGKMGGTEIYVRELVGGLARIDRANEYVILANRESAPTWGALPGNFSVYECPVMGAAKGARTLFEQLRLNRILKRLDVGLLHSLGSTAPPRVKGIGSIVTIADVIFLRYPKEFGLVQRLVAGHLLRRAARGSDRIVTVSRFSGKDIADVLRVPPAKIRVAVEAGRVLPRDPAGAEEFFRRGRIRKPYIFSVLATYHHKNIAGLLRAFHSLKKERELPHTLVIAGLSMAAHREVLRLRDELGLSETVTFTGWAPDAALRALYEQSDCFVFPSLYEGFGLPVLEAMSLGAPVACSNTTSVREVAGDAAVTFDPTNTREMATAVERVVSNAGLRASLVERGRARAAEFTWEQCAHETLSVYRELGAE